MNQSQVLSSVQHDFLITGLFKYDQIEKDWNHIKFNPLISNQCTSMSDHLSQQLSLFCKLYQIPEIIYSRCVVTNVLKVQKLTLVKTHNGIVDMHGNLYARVSLNVLDSGNIKFNLSLHPSLFNYTGDNDIGKLIGFFKLMVHSEITIPQLIYYSYNKTLYFDFTSYQKEKVLKRNMDSNRKAYLATPNILILKRAESKLNESFRNTTGLFGQSFKQLFIQE